jgi:hypothetical protein
MNSDTQLYDVIDTPGYPVVWWGSFGIGYSVKLTLEQQAKVIPTDVWSELSDELTRLTEKANLDIFILE